MPAECVSRSLWHHCLPLDLSLGLPLSLGVPRELEQPLLQARYPAPWPVLGAVCCYEGQSPCLTSPHSRPAPLAQTHSQCLLGSQQLASSLVFQGGVQGGGPSPSVPLHTLTLQRKGYCGGGEKWAPLFWHPRKDKIDAALRCSSSGHVLQCQSTASPRRAVMV